MGWGTIIEVIKLGPTIPIAAAVACIIVLLMPPELAQKLGFLELIKPYRGWISLAGILLFCFGLAQLVPSIWEWRKQRGKRREIINALDSLSNEEAFLLGYCLSRNRRTVLLAMLSKEYAIAAGLCHKMLMQKAFGQQMISAVPHTIPDFVWQEMQSRFNSFPSEDNNQGIAKYYNSLDKTTSGANIRY